ncbi:MAG: hypothetical protein ACE5HE_06565, partial [Phycisphaerae bacterium]
TNPFRALRSGRSHCETVDGYRYAPAYPSLPKLKRRSYRKSYAETLPVRPIFRPDGMDLVSACAWTVGAGKGLVPRHDLLEVRTTFMGHGATLEARRFIAPALARRTAPAAESLRADR